MKNPTTEIRKFAIYKCLNICYTTDYSKGIQRISKQSVSGGIRKVAGNQALWMTILDTANLDEKTNTPGTGNRSEQTSASRNDLPGPERISGVVSERIESKQGAAFGKAASNDNVRTLL